MWGDVADVAAASEACSVCVLPRVSFGSQPSVVLLQAEQDPGWLGARVALLGLSILLSCVLFFSHR